MVSLSLSNQVSTPYKRVLAKNGLDFSKQPEMAIASLLTGLNYKNAEDVALLLLEHSRSENLVVTTQLIQLTCEDLAIAVYLSVWLCGLGADPQVEINKLRKLSHRNADYLSRIEIELVSRRPLEYLTELTTFFSFSSQPSYTINSLYTWLYLNKPSVESRFTQLQQYNYVAFLLSCLGVDYPSLVRQLNYLCSRAYAANVFGADLNQQFYFL